MKAFLLNRRNLVVIFGIIIVLCILLFNRVILHDDLGHWETVSLWTGHGVETVDKTVWVGSGYKTVIDHGINGDVVKVVPVD